MWIVELRKVRKFASVYIESENWFGLKSMLIAGRVLRATMLCCLLSASVFFFQLFTSLSSSLGFEALEAELIHLWTLGR